eukprot:3934037-Rhodomonas_salina.2
MPTLVGTEETGFMINSDNPMEAVVLHPLDFEDRFDTHEGSSRTHRLPASNSEWRLRVVGPRFLRVCGLTVDGSSSSGLRVEGHVEADMPCCVSGGVRTRGLLGTGMACRALRGISSHQESFQSFHLRNDSGDAPDAAGIPLYLLPPHLEPWHASANAPDADSDGTPGHPGIMIPQTGGPQGHGA